MSYTACAFIVSFCLLLNLQNNSARPQFEVASVRPVSKSQIDDPAFASVFREARRNLLRGGEIPLTGKDRVHLRNWTLLDLIAAAYSLHTTQVSGPAWLSDQTFDVEARLPDGTSKRETNAMLQSLLEERFALRVHRTTQIKEGYAITVGKGGPKLTPAESSRDPSPRTSEKEQNVRDMQGLMAAKKVIIDSDKAGAGMTYLSWPSITLEELAFRLGRFTEAPVVDRTGLTGEYAVTINVSADSDGLGNTIFDAVERLGLRLERRKVPMETLVVDQVSKSLSPN